MIFAIGSYHPLKLVRLIERGTSNVLVKIDIQCGGMNHSYFNNLIKRLLILPFLLFPFLILAQSINLGTPFIKNFQKKDYQGGTQNWDIAQSKQGVIYVANNTGLLRYDGTDWSCTPLPNKTILRSITIDDSGKIYAGGQGEFGYFLPNKKGLLEFVSLKELIPEEHRQFEDVWEIVIFQQCIYFRSSNKIFQLKDDNVHVFSDNSPLTFLGKANDELFIFSSHQGFKKFNGNDFIAIEGGDIFNGKQISAIIYRPNLGYLIGTFKSGVYIYDGEKIEFWNNPLQDFFIQNRLNTLQTINGKKIAFGTMLGGVVIMDEHYKPLWKLNKKSGLINNNVLSLFEDVAGQLWLGYDNGIGYVQANKPLSYLIPDGELEGTAYCAIVHKNKLYLGTTNGLYVKDWQGYYNPFEGVGFQLVEGTKGQVWGLSEVNGELFLGHTEGAFLIKGNTATKIHGHIGTWMFLPIESDKNKIFAGTYYGINLLEKKNGKWKLEKNLEGLLAESSRILAKAPNNDYWMAHPYRGVFRIQLDEAIEDMKSSTFYGKEKGLASDIFNYVFLIFNKILVTSERGIFYYDETEDAFKTYEEFNSLFDKNEQVLRLFEDKAGNVWFVTSEEIGYLKVIDNGLKKEVSKIVIPELKGKLVGGFEYIYPYDENNIFIGTDKGFIHYDANQEGAHPNQKPQVILSQVDLLLLQKDSLLFQGAFSDGSQIVMEQPKGAIPEFTNQENAIRFKFSATEFDNPEMVKYQYFLEGGEEMWSEWISKTEKEYNHLKHGDYIFKVRAKKGDGTMSDEVHYRFSISPPWYATTLAFGIYSLLFAGLLLGLILVPRRQYQKEKEQLQSEHQQVVEETEQKIADLEQVKLQTEIDHQNQTLATTTMHLVQKKEMLSRMKDELKKIAKTKEHKDRKEIERIIRMIEQDARLDDDWEQFSLYFDKVHSDFLKKLSNKYPHLTPKDKKLCAYLRMNLSTKEIAPLMNISVRGVEISRYRLRQKLEMPSGGNLVGFLMDI